MSWFRKYIIDKSLEKLAAYKTVPVHEWRDLNAQVSEKARAIYNAIYRLNDELSYGDITELEEPLRAIDVGIFDLNAFIESGELNQVQEVPSLHNPMLGLVSLLEDRVKELGRVLADPNVSRDQGLTDRIAHQKRSLVELIEKASAIQ